MEETDPQSLADDMERQGRDLQQRGDDVGQQIDDTRQEWQRKQSDASVPGANPRAEDFGGEDRSEETSGSEEDSGAEERDSHEDE